MNSTRLVIFDVDGTLVDSQDLIVAAQRMAFAACGLPAPPRAGSWKWCMRICARARS